MNTPVLIAQSGAAAFALRKGLGLNQADFWGRVSVTQSGGSRYEAGRDMPVQVAWALHIAYGTENEVQALVDWLRSESGVV